MIRSKEKVLRSTKIILLITTAIFFTLIVLNNFLDYNSNYMFVEHVLSMDTTFEGNNLMERAITSPLIHHAFYWMIILIEILAAIVLWIASFKCIKFYKSKKFEKGLNMGIIGLTIGLILWFFAFITIGGEWFLMWQSEIWNGQDAAFRMFTINAITLLILSLKE